MRAIRLLRLAATIAAVLLITSCGGGGGGGTTTVTQSAAPPTVVVTPGTPNVLQGATLAFTATVNGVTSTAVTWSIQEGAAGGTITAAGNYTAPTAAGTFHVVATTQTSPAGTASATITVPAASVTAPVTSANVLQGGQQTFTATSNGTASTNVNWSIQEGAAGGTINAAGQYTAPNAAGTFHLVATSQTNPAATATINVTVPDVSIAIVPSSGTVYANTTQQFTATVGGTVNTAVTWTVQEGGSGGSISAGGAYTAPGTLGTFHIVATSVANPARTATFTATIARQLGSILVYSSAPVPQGGTRRLAVQLRGTVVTSGVNWSVQEPAGGTIDPNGLYHAPGTPGTYHISASTPGAKPEIASATLTVGPVSVSITPAQASIVQSERFTFIPVVTGTVNTAVTWSVQEAGGVLSSDGTFSALGNTPLGDYHVVATSVDDPTKSAVAVVSVGGGRQQVDLQNFQGVISGPTSVVQQSRWQLFFGSGGYVPAINWSVVQGAAGGSINPVPHRFKNENAIYTAPAQAGVFQVLATPALVFGSSAPWPITVNPITNLSIEPANEIVGPGRQRTLHAQTLSPVGPVSSLVPVAASWQASGGAIDGSGVFTAPAATGTYSITANAVLSANATVTVANSGFFTTAAQWPDPILQSARGVSATALPGGQVLLYGGLADDQTNAVNACYIFDPASGTISPGPTTGRPRFYHTATLLADGKVLLAGGFIRNFIPLVVGGVDPVAVATADLYDPVAGTITPLADMAAKHARHTATLLPNGKVLVFGAYPGGGPIAELFDPLTSTFSNAPAPIVARSSHTATLLNDGRVFIAGGDASTEFYSPLANTFTAGPNMAASRSRGTATLLVDGRVLLAGGGQGSGESAEILSPATNTISATGSLRLGRPIASAAVLLPTGQVLIAGGIDTGTNSGFRSAELFDPTSGTFRFTGGTESSSVDASTLVPLPDGTILLLNGSLFIEVYHP